MMLLKIVFISIYLIPEIKLRIENIFQILQDTLDSVTCKGETNTIRDLKYYVICGLIETNSRFNCKVVMSDPVCFKILLHWRLAQIRFFF